MTTFFLVEVVLWFDSVDLVCLLIQRVSFSDLKKALPAEKNLVRCSLI